MSKKKPVKIKHRSPTSEELKTEPECPIEGTDLHGASLGNLLFYTDDLDQFHLIPGNRIVRETRIQKLVATMTLWGWLYNQPATVTPSGGVVDGQGRYMGAQRIDEGMFFTILDPDIPKKEAIKIFNEAQESWTFQDYFSGLKTGGVEPFEELWNTWKVMDAEFDTTLSPTAFLSAFGISLEHLKEETTPADYDFLEGVHTIREIAEFAEIAPRAISSAFKQTKTISVYRAIRKLRENGWDPDNVIRTLRASHTEERRQAWKDGLTSSAPLGRRLAFTDIHNWKKQTKIFTPPAEWMQELL